MTVYRKLQFGFTGGVISPNAQGRVDIDKYQLGLEVGHNFVVSPLGPAQNRAGFQYVKGFSISGNNATSGRVIPFRRSSGFDDVPVSFYLDRIYPEAEPLGDASAIMKARSDGTRTLVDYSADTAMEDYLYDGGFIFIESYNPHGGEFGARLGDSFFRVVNLDTTADTFYIERVNGSGIDSSGWVYDAAETLLVSVPVSASFPLTAQQAQELTYAQVDKDLFLAHPDKGVYRLHIDSFTAEYTSWYFERVDFARDYSGFAPTGAGAAPTGTGSKEYKYQVTAVNYEGVESEPASAADAGTANVVTNIAFKTQRLSSRYGTTTSNVALEVTCSSLTGLVHGAKARLENVTGAPELEGKTFLVSYGIWTRYGVVFPAANSVLLVTESQACPVWSGSFTAGTATLTSDYSTNDLSVVGQYNTITWDRVTSAARYNVYKKSENSDAFGYIGSTAGLTFKDDNIVPDESVAPPKRENPFNGADNYPAALAGHDRRMVFGGSRNGPAYVWATGINELDAFMASFPPNADDAFSLRAASVAGRIAHLVSLDHLVALTTREEVAFLTPNAETLTPTNVVPRVQSRVGCNAACPPVAAGGSVLFSAAANAHIYALSRATDYAFTTDDLSVLASHLFVGKKVVSSAFCEMPDPVAWFALDDGTALSLTFLPSQKVIAWCTHSTEGLFKCFASLRVGGVDVLYAVVVRGEGVDAKTMLEKMEAREETTSADCIYLDSSVVWEPTESTPEGYIDFPSDVHLLGATAGVLADGAYLGEFEVVSDGAGGAQIALPEGTAPTKAIVGYAYSSKLKTLPPVIDNGVTGETLNAVDVRVHLRSTRGVQVGTDDTALFEPEPFAEASYDGLPPLRSGVVDIPLLGNWTTEAQVTVQQDYPLPVTVVALQVNLARG